MYSSSLTVYTHVEVGECCQIKFRVSGGNEVWVHFGDDEGKEEFELALDQDALAALLRHGKVALKEMRAL